MKSELVIKKCLKCGSVVSVIKDCDFKECNLMCCNEPMCVVKPNSIDASIEKHVPTYKVENDEVIVNVNHVMDDDHFIEWICLKTLEKEEFFYFKPGEVATAVFKNVKSGTLYAYCNKHGLWNVKIDG